MKYINTKQQFIEGTYPKFKDNPVLKIINFSEETQVFRKTANVIEKVMGFGIIEYKKPIWSGHAEAYYMIPLQEG